MNDFISKYVEHIKAGDLSDFLTPMQKYIPGAMIGVLNKHLFWKTDWKTGRNKVRKSIREYRNISRQYPGELLLFLDLPFDRANTWVYIDFFITHIESNTARIRGASCNIQFAVGPAFDPLHEEYNQIGFNVREVFWLRRSNKNAEQFIDQIGNDVVKWYEKVCQVALEFRMTEMIK